MPITKNVSLKSYNTFGIDAKAASFCDISSIASLKEILKEKHSNKLFILGGGSNMLLTKDIEALVLHINLKGIAVVSETEHTVVIKAMAGENWHDYVLWCLDHNYGGVENMSLIPGNMGTAPIQNIGAYGIELKDVFVSCEAVNIKNQTTMIFTASDCNFGYRESIFKQELKAHYIITSVNLKLTKVNHNIRLD
jgi:UDP-N-acetylmuramate dehydrogenase